MIFTHNMTGDMRRLETCSMRNRKAVKSEKLEVRSGGGEPSHCSYIDSIPIL